MISPKIQSAGECMICRKVVEKSQMMRHLKSCVEKNTENPEGKSAQLFHVFVEGRYLPMYWLHLEITGALTLEQLDSFLRDIWLECCGHLSAFKIEDQRYASLPAEESMWGLQEKTMRGKIYNILKPGLRFTHEYDYGSTTELALKVIRVRKGAIPKGGVRLLARNQAPEISCVMCGKPATKICSLCRYEGDPWFCDDCAPKHDCEAEGEAFLPVVNSPRVGVCGYCG
ncbi:MAG: hypothetical protein V1789_06755 [PVC group bacterium]